MFSEFEHRVLECSALHSYSSPIIVERLIIVGQLNIEVQLIIEVISALSCWALRSILQQSGRGLLPGPWANTTNMHPIILNIIIIRIICLAWIGAFVSIL